MNGCCARHPTAKVCQIDSDRNNHRVVGAETWATPEDRERDILALQHASERRAVLEHRRHPNTDGFPFYWSPPPNRSALPRGCSLLAAADAGKSPLPIPPLQWRTDLAALLNAEGMTSGVEVGVKKGLFARAILRAWTICKNYTLIDLWREQPNYADRANVNNAEQERNYRITVRRLQSYARGLTVCRDLSVRCAARIADASQDFIYIDARHDYKGVLEDLIAFWPKLRVGGIMVSLCFILLGRLGRCVLLPISFRRLHAAVCCLQAGHDYLVASEIPMAGVRNARGELKDDWSISADGSHEPRGTKGAVDDFFSSSGCVPRQISVTYREPIFNSWVVRK